MGFFDKILDTLGFGSAKAAAPEPKKVDLEPIFVEPPKPSAPAAPAGTPVPTVETPKAVAVVDVVAQLEARAAKSAQKLNWRTSIVDLLKLLDLDSSLGARKELAKELGCPEDLMGDSAKMNMWLHKTVLARLAANGGNVPADLLD
jgi:hypothetical protein